MNDVLMAIFGPSTGVIMIKIMPYILSGLSIIFTVTITLIAIVMKIWVVPLIFTWWNSRKNGTEQLVTILTEVNRNIVQMSERLDNGLRGKNDLSAEVARSIIGLMFGKYTLEIMNFLDESIKENHFISGDGLPNDSIAKNYEKFFQRTCGRWLYMCKQITVEGKSLRVWAEGSKEIFDALKERAYNRHYAIAYNEQPEDKNFSLYLDNLQSEIMSTVIEYVRTDKTLNDTFGKRFDIIVPAN